MQKFVAVNFHLRPPALYCYDCEVIWLREASSEKGVRSNNVVAKIIQIQLRPVSKVISEQVEAVFVG